MSVDTGQSMSGYTHLLDASTILSYSVNVVGILSLTMVVGFMFLVAWTHQKMYLE